MKYLLNIGFLLFVSINGFGQTMQASIGAGSSPTRVRVYIKPITAVSGVISTLQFDVAIDALVTPAPALTIVNAVAFGISWNIDPSYIEDGLRHYQFTTASSPSVTINAGDEIMVMELEFSGGPITGNNVSLVTLPGGGASTGNALFFCSGAASSIEGQLYYARPGTTVINNMSYTGALPSSATVGGILLPVNWLSFNVVKQGNNGLLNWSVANEDANHHFEVQRSNNGINFTTIATINKSGNAIYNYTDWGINNLGSAFLYYRIKQVDIDGKLSYSDLRMLRLDNKGSQISIYPNPVKEGFYISIPFTNPDNRIVKLNLITTNGQLIRSKKITTLQAANYYFNISDMTLAAGNYYLEIIFDDRILESKKLYVDH